MEKLKAPLFRGLEGGGATNDWCSTKDTLFINKSIKHCLIRPGVNLGDFDDVI